MKRKTVLAVLFCFLGTLMLLACTSSNVQGEQSAMGPEQSAQTSAPDATAGAGVLDGPVDLTGYGSMGALADENLTLEEMLTYALEDEYYAHTEYEMILDKFGDVRPFSNIVGSEQTHINALIPLFEAYDYRVPDDESAGLVTIPDTFEEALGLCAEAEVYNIDMYEVFLEQEVPDDVRTVFEQLKRASESHLEAFSR